MVFEGRLFFIDDAGLLVRYDLNSSLRMNVEVRVCDSFTIGEETLYAIYDGQVYTHSLEGDVVGPAASLDLEDDYQSISYYYNELGSSKTYLFLMSTEDHLYRYHDEELDIVASYILDYVISDNGIYYLDSNQRLMEQPLNLSNLAEIAENVQFFDFSGRNILYITTSGALYNIHRGILGSRIYQGDLRGLALDFNYLEITEGLVSDTEYNHLMTLFYAREYFGN
jgi:hypothetical protein